MKQTLLIITALMLVVGCSESDAQQKVITVTETYKDGDASKISYHKITGNKIELVKEIDWYTNGQKKEEVTYKDGEYDGLWTYWDENGQKWAERTYKDGKEIESTSWYENGQKESEITYKDGEVISGKCWDEVGNEIDCDDFLGR
jgi:antitoxin component YwqK of YwqJK toxin-antitoxin module